MATVAVWPCTSTTILLQVDITVEINGTAAGLKDDGVWSPKRLEESRKT